MSTEVSYQSPDQSASGSTAELSPQVPMGRSEPVRMRILPWNDPALAGRGVDPRGEYTERFWLGVVGPSVVFLIRRLTRGLHEHPNGFTVSVPDTARAIGLGAGLSPSSPMAKTIERACIFGLMRRVGHDALEVRTQLPPLTRRQLKRLPLAVRNSHAAWRHHGAA